MAAALRLRVAQPALSRQLRILERELGTPLFERHARGVRLLPAGKVFLEHARRLVSDVAAASSAARRAAEEASGLHLRLAPPDWPHRSLWVGTVLERLGSGSPEVTVDFHSVPWLLHADAVRKGVIDLGFGVGMSGADFGEGIEAEHLCTEPGSSAVLPITHALARRTSLQLSDLRDLPTLIPPRAIAPLLHDHMLALLRHGGYEPRVGVAGASFSDTMQLVTAGAGWVLVINSVREAPNPGTVVIPISDAPVMLNFFALRRSYDDNAGVRKFMAHLRDVASEHEAGNEQPA
jgi:DNA-binding transcriptional LysR family regulator